MPEEERYDGYLQLENGVGMMRLLQNEFAEELCRGWRGTTQNVKLSIATGSAGVSIDLVEMAYGRCEKKYHEDEDPCLSVSAMISLERRLPCQG